MQGRDSQAVKHSSKLDGMTMEWTLFHYAARTSNPKAEYHHRLPRVFISMVDLDGGYSMAVYKKSGRKPYYFNYVDAKGIRRFKSSGTTDKKSAEIIEAKFRTDVALRQHNIIDTESEAAHDRLASPISEHLEAYEASFRQRNATEKHVDSSRNIIDRMIESQGIETLGDFNDAKVTSFVDNLVKDRRSSRTIEANLQAIKAFAKWLLKSKRVTVDILASVDKPKANGQKVVIRRALTHEEWVTLDSYCRSSSTSFGMSGKERALLYATAIQTGLRSNELRSITRGNLLLKTASPCILVDAKSTKNRKQARQYIQPELATELQNMNSKKLAGASVFAMPSKFDVADMLRHDMEEARQALLRTISDAQERIEADKGDFLKSFNSAGETLDFHALRHTTATWLIEAGADPKTVQSVMRHSTIKLTLDTYGHLFPGSEANAVATIRDRFVSPKQATGTESMGTLWAHFGHGSMRLGAVPCGGEGEESSKHETHLALQNIGKTNDSQGQNNSRPSRARTYDLRIRNPLLCPTEL